MKNYIKRILKGHLVVSIAIIFLLIVIGTIGYMALEKIGPMEALYHTVVTMATVGYSDIATKDSTRIFTIGLILASVAAFYYFAGAIVETLISGRIFEVFKLGTLEEGLSRKKNHVILCGYGDVGALAAEKITDAVVVERDEEKYKELLKKNFLAVKGDSTSPETLKLAGVDRARGMIIALDSDPEVVYTILTAKELNPDIKIYARANEVTSVSKMKKAGANYVICLPEIGSRDLINALQGSTKECLGDKIEGEKS
jgi:voltage-gated potassium channel